MGDVMLVNPLVVEAEDSGLLEISPAEVFNLLDGTEPFPGEQQHHVVSLAGPADMLNDDGVLAVSSQLDPFEEGDEDRGGLLESWEALGDAAPSPLASDDARDALDERSVPQGEGVTFDSWCKCGGLAVEEFNNDDSCARCQRPVAGVLGRAAPASAKASFVMGAAAMGYAASPVTVPLSATVGGVAGAGMGGICGPAVVSDDYLQTDAAKAAVGAAGGGVAGAVAGALTAYAAPPLAAASLVAGQHVPRHHCRACGRSLCEECLGDVALPLSPTCDRSHKVCLDCCRNPGVTREWKLRELALVSSEHAAERQMLLLQNQEQPGGLSTGV